MPKQILRCVLDSDSLKRLAIKSQKLGITLIASMIWA